MISRTQLSRRNFLLTTAAGVTWLTTMGKANARVPAGKEGHGLTYSTVEYGPTRCSAPTMTRDGELAISARITNRGARSVDEVVQLYIHDRVASVVQPVRRLVAFQKVVLAGAASQTVTFRIRATDLGFLDRASKRVIEPGDFDVWIAPSAGAGQSARFTLV